MVVLLNVSSLSLSASAVENVASHSLGVCELSRVYGGHRGEEKTSDSRNSDLLL